MKRVIITLLALSAAYRGMSQGQAPTDTVKIQMGDEYLTLPLPKDGHKVTINFEDSNSITQVSIGRTIKGKSNIINSNPFSSTDKKQEKESRRKISWFNMIEFGLTGMIGRAKLESIDTAYGSIFSTQLNGTYNRATLVQITPKNVYPGIVFGLNIREKRRPLGNTKLMYISGTKFRYARFGASGTYDTKEIKVETTNGVMKYYYDSVYSRKNGEFRSSSNMFQLLLPFMLEYKVEKSKKDLTIGAGLNLVFNFNSSRVRTTTGDDLKSSYFIVSYFTNSFLQLQPQVRVGFKRWNVNLSTTLNAAKLGYGATSRIQGVMTYLTLGYKLY